MPPGKHGTMSRFIGVPMDRYKWSRKDWKREKRF